MLGASGSLISALRKQPATALRMPTRLSAYLFHASTAMAGTYREESIMKKLTANLVQFEQTQYSKTPIIINLLQVISVVHNAYTTEGTTVSMIRFYMTGLQAIDVLGDINDFSALISEQAV